MSAVSDKRRTAAWLGMRYAVGLTYAHLSAAVAVMFVAASLTGDMVAAAGRFMTDRNLVALAGLVAFSAAMGTAVGVRRTLPTFRWFAAGRQPDTAEQHAAMRISSQQAVLHFAIWLLGGMVFLALNPGTGVASIVVIVLSVVFGGAMAACTGWLITQRVLRPIIAIAMRSSTSDVELPGISARLIIIWALFTALPVTGVALIVLARSHGWYLVPAASIETPVLVLSLVALSFSLRAILLVARSISDPVHDVVAAMGEVESGRTDVDVDVYEPSEIGRLQSGFNRMVAGLSERERIRDLFGRYVGVDVAQRAVKQETFLSGDVRVVAVLYVDLVGSTEMAASLPPDEVAEVLNRFFRIVVDAVEARHGLINKFQGDAVLAVFGAPLDLDSPSSAAMAAARALAADLCPLPVDFGIGVSCGSVFAGTVGAENRYEYTVLGDPVNEAARLADLAKEWPSRVLCSGDAIRAAETGERDRWAPRGQAVLRGRSEPTDLAVPL
jgi:class 3 adenylate cyclase